MVWGNAELKSCKQTKANTTVIFNTADYKQKVIASLHNLANMMLAMVPT